MVLDATQRRIRRKFEKAQPDLHGFLPTDGISIAIALTDDKSEDLLGLEDPDDSAGASLARQIDAGEQPA